MKKAYLFPGQGSQKKGMGQDHYRFDQDFRKRCDQANEILGFRITDIMFEDEGNALTQTKFTQPALFVHACALFEMLRHHPDVVAGHSLGEYTALTAAGVIRFEDALVAVKKRGELMQRAGENNPGAMAAVIGLEDAVVEKTCEEVSAEGEGTVVPANYNARGQLVISGNEQEVTTAVEKLKESGAKMAKTLPVSGAFHSSLMESAREELDTIIDDLIFVPPKAFVYSNVTGMASKDPDVLKQDLKKQLMSPVRWTQTLNAMYEDGVRHYVEVGPGNVLQGLVKRTLTDIEISGFQ